MFEIGFNTWEEFDTMETADTLEKAIEIAERLYKEMNGDEFTDEESIEVWEGTVFRYMACGE
jgi:hypothetical protein